MEEDLDQNTKNHRVFLAIILITLIVIVFLLISYFLILPIIERKLGEMNESVNGLIGNQSALIPNQTPLVNNSTPETPPINITPIDNSSTDEPDSDVVPNPIGTLKGIDIRNDGGGGYWCNGSVDAEHKIKLYTYRNLEGTRVLSDNYLESTEIDNVCSFYSDIANNTLLRYDIRWTWTPIEGIDGYKVYQYYLFQNITRRYDYSLELPSNAEQLLDTGPNLWRWEKK